MARAVRRLHDAGARALGLAIVGSTGYPIFRKRESAVLHRQIIAPTMMSRGVVAALIVGQWVAAAVVVFFQRVGEDAEGFTTAP